MLLLFTDTLIFFFYLFRNFAPVLDIPMNKQWPRVFENFGEDPFLSGVLGKAAIHGYQGKYELWKNLFVYLYISPFFLILQGNTKLTGQRWLLVWSTL